MRRSRAGLLRLEGCNYTLGRIAIAFKTCGEYTNGAYTLCETVEPSGSNARLHRHPTYDETFIICEGRFSFRLGDETMELGPARPSSSRAAPNTPSPASAPSRAGN